METNGVGLNGSSAGQGVPPTDDSNQGLPPQQQPRQEFDAQPQPPHFAAKAVRRKKRLWLIGAIALAALLVGGGAYWFFVMNKKESPAQAATSTTPPPAAAEEEAATGDGSPATYKSSKLNVEFTHPNNWKVREAADRSEVTITSPPVTYAKTDGSSAQGVFTLKMRTGTIPEAIQSTVVKAIAVRDSETIAYDAPTDQQRQYTNLTDAGADANTFNFVIVSSSTAFKAGQPLGYGVSLTGDAYLFAGGYGKDEGNTLTFDGVSKTEFVTPTYEQAVAILKSLKIY